MGGSLNVAVGGDSTTIGGDVLTEFGRQMIDLVADVARNPKFPEPSAAAQGGPDPATSRSLGASRSSSRSRSSAPCSTATILRPGVSDRGHDQGLHARAGPRLLPEPTAPAAPASTSSGGSTPPRPKRRSARPSTDGAKGPAPSRRPSRRRRARLHHRSARRGAIHRADRHAAIDPSNDDFVALTVMDALLGGAFASRITKNIREDKGYTYSPYSELSTRYRDAYWAENADVTTAVTGPSIKEIFAEIDRLQAEPPDRRGAEGHPELSGRHLRPPELQPRRHHQQLDYMDLHGLPASYAKYVKQVYAVTPQKVTEVAKKHLQDDRRDRDRRRSQGDRGAGQGFRHNRRQISGPPCATRVALPAPAQPALREIFHGCHGLIRVDR